MDDDTLNNIERIQKYILDNRGVELSVEEINRFLGFAMNMGDFQLWCLEQEYEYGKKYSREELLRKFLKGTSLDEILVLYDILENTGEKNINNILKELNETDEMNNRPEGYPPLKIDEAMEVYDKTIYYGQSRLEDKVDEIKNRIADLKEDSKVIEYIELKNDLDFLSSAYVKDNQKTSHLQKRMCNHPLYGVLNRKAICTVCGTTFDFDKEQLQDLIESKKLIADGLGYDNLKKAYPIKKISLKEIREYYLEQYNNNICKNNIEELVWGHFLGKKMDLLNYDYPNLKVTEELRESIKSNPEKGYDYRTKKGMFRTDFEEQERRNVWDVLKDGMDAIDASDTKENMFAFPYWYNEDLYEMSFEELCELDDDDRQKIIEEKTGQKIKPDTDTIWIGGNPYRGIKTMEDVDKDLDQINQRMFIDTTCRVDGCRVLTANELNDRFNEVADEINKEPTFLEKAKQKIKSLTRKK